MTTEQWLLALLRTVLCGEAPPKTPTFEELRAVLALAKRHDLSHLVYVALKQHGALPTPKNEQQQAELDDAAKDVIIVQYRYLKQQAELEHIGTVFTREGIDYMPMKGSVLRVLYPEEWMRTGCDIDVLVRESDLDRAVEALVAEGFETDGVRNHHDVLLRCDIVNLELHHNLLERMPQSDAVLETVWEHTVSKEQYHVETPEFFLYHHIAHMAHHFVCGGCGARTVMDLWLLRQNSPFSADTVQELLVRGGLSTFAEQMFQLADIWFGAGEHTEHTRRIEQFILCGGAYGSESQRYALSAARHGKGNFARRVVFMPYEDLRHVYPRLDGKRMLTPFYQCCRIGTRLKQGRGKGAVDRIRKVGGQSGAAVRSMQEFLNEVGLSPLKEGDTV